MSGAAAGPSALSVVTQWKPDHRIAGRYRVQAPLGRGTGGAVLAVDDANHSLVVRPLPVTVLEDHRRLAALRQAALALAGCAHSGLVRIREVGVDPGCDIAFIASDLVDGPSLYEVLAKRGPLEPREALALVASVASALSAAHQAGVVHGDLKPEHIIIGRDGVARVIDFGLARDTRFTPHPKLARTGVIASTPEFASPEVARGEVADARSDVYSLGACLYEALVGEPPWTGDATQVLVARVSSLPPSPLARAPGLDRRVEALVLRALAPDPRARFGSMADLEYQVNLLAAGALPPSVEGLALVSETRPPPRAPRLPRKLPAFSEAVRSWRASAELPVPQDARALLLSPEELAAAAAANDDGADVQDLDWLKLSMSPEQMQTFLTTKSSQTKLPVAPPPREPPREQVRVPSELGGTPAPVSALTTVPVREGAPGAVPGGPPVSVASVVSSTPSGRHAQPGRSTSSGERGPSTTLLWGIAAALAVLAIVALLVLR